MQLATSEPTAHSASCTAATARPAGVGEEGHLLVAAGRDAAADGQLKGAVIVRVSPVDRGGDGATLVVGVVEAGFFQQLFVLGEKPLCSAVHSPQVMVCS